MSVILSPAQAVDAQYYFYNADYYGSNLVVEAGLSGGLINCLTDLGGQKGSGRGFIKDLDWKESRPAAGLYFAISYREMLALRLEAGFGKIAANDHSLKTTDPDLTGRYGRNLAFRSPLNEWQLLVEWHPVPLFSGGNAGRLSPYLLAGLGYFSFRPQAEWQGQWYDLPNLRTEGQGFAEYPTRKPYRLQQLSLPLGIGLRFEIHPLLYLRVEAVPRILFTDYLDDVSGAYIDPALFKRYLPPGLARVAAELHSRMHELQPGYRVTEGMARGDASDRDSFFTIQLKIGYVFRRKK